MQILLSPTGNGLWEVRIERDGESRVVGSITKIGSGFKNPWRWELKDSGHSGNARSLAKAQAAIEQAIESLF